MRKRFGIVILLLFILMISIFLCGCSLYSKGLKMLNSGKNALESRIGDDEGTANAELNKILDAIKNKDEDTLKSMFATKAIDKTYKFDNKLSELLDFFQGDLVSYNAWGVETSESSDYGDRKKTLYSSYDVVTTKQNYRIAMKDTVIDTANKENVGVWSFYIIKLEDDTDPKIAYRADNSYIPGIYFNIKNTEY